MAFPTTGILDNFNRANQGPPPTGWTTIYNGHKVVSNALQGNTGGDANVSVWNTTGLGPSIEAYITIVNTGSFVTLYIIDAALSVGYSVAYGADAVQVFRQDEFGVTETQLGADISVTMGAGDALGMYYDAATDTIYAYRKPSGGSWAELGSRSDSTYTSLSRIGLFTYTTNNFDDFGGGTVVGAQSIAPNHITSSGTVYAPTVSHASSTQSITPDAISSTAAVYNPTFAPGTVTITPDAISSTAAVYSPDFLMAACISGVLRQNTANGRYLENDSGPLVLTGFHTWYNLQDGGATDPPPAFGWDDFVDHLVGKGVNYTKLWRLESARDWPSDNTQIFGVQPWARTGPGNAADGHLKFDLDTFDTDYFERLRARCIQLGNAGIYVAIQLFNGFHIDNTKPGGGAGDPWAYHPLEDGNNINSIDGDTDNDGIGEEIRTTTFTAAYNYQKAFVEQVIDTVNDLDNVLIEISNEDGTYAEAWQKALIDYIQTYESGLPKQHPVGMTKLYPSGTNSMLTSSNADWISPDEDLAPVAQNSTDQSWMYDTDHTVGDTDTYEWIFRALCMGYGGAWYMDPWDSTGEGDTTVNPTYELIREILGYALNYAAQIDLENATPQASLSTTGYCLAKLTGIYQFLVYQDGTGNFNLTLTSYAGTFTLEWLRLSDGTTQAGSNVSGGAVRTLTPPWSGSVAAFLELIASQSVTPDNLTNTSTIHEPTVTPGSATAVPDHLTNSSTVHNPTLIPGAVTITPDHLSNSSTIHEPTVTASGEIVPAHLTNISVIHEPTTTPGAVTVEPDHLTNTSNIHSPTVSGAAAISPDHLSNSSTVHEPTVTPGAATVTPDTIISGTAVHSPTITPGAITITPDHLTNTSTIYAPFIGTGTTQTIAPDHLTNTSQVWTLILLSIPASRVYHVEAEDRVFVVASETRIYTIDE